MQWREAGRDLLWAIPLFCAVLAYFSRTFGTSPHVWPDTVIEEQFIARCLHHGNCTGIGAGATAGIFHSAGYLHWRTLLAWLGQGPDGTYQLLLALNALGVVLVALAARRVEGPVAAALAALLATAANGIPMQLHVISDVAPVPFLGSVLLFVGVAAVATPSLLLTASFGLVVGVMANVYVTGLFGAISAGWIALLIRERRWTHVATALGTSALSAFLLSPQTWITDAGIVLHRGVSNATVVSLHQLSSLPMAPLAFAACLAWALAALTFRKSFRAKLDVAAAIIVPLFAAMVLESARGRLDPQAKYFASIVGPVAFALGVTVAALVRVILPFTARPEEWPGSLGHVTKAGAATEPTSALARIGILVSRLAPFAAILAITFGWGRSVAVKWFVADLMDDFTYDELASIDHTLLSDQGWSWSTYVRNLKTPSDIVAQAARSWAERPSQGAEHHQERAYVLRVPREFVPRALPPGVRVISENAQTAVVLGQTCSWIDWRAFRVCLGETCVDTGIPDADADPGADVEAIRGLPVSAPDAEHRRMTLHLPLRPRAECPDEWVYMPEVRPLCRGRLVGVNGSNALVDPAGRWARLASSDLPLDQPAEQAMEFEIGDDCQWADIRGTPPFFVEGAPAVVSSLSGMLVAQTVSAGSVRRELDESILPWLDELDFIGAFKPLVPGTWSGPRFTAHPEGIELAFTDGATTHAVQLAVDRVSRSPRDGTGRHFTFRISGKESSEAAQALLRAADLVDFRMTADLFAPIPEVLATTQSSPTDIVSDGTALYWTSGESIDRRELAGSAASTLVTGRQNIGNLSIGSTHLYWTEETTPGSANSTQLLSMPLTGGDVQTLASGLRNVRGLTVMNGAVYWTEDPGAVRAVSAQGGAPRTIAEGAGPMGGIASDCERLVWAESGWQPRAGRIVTVPLTGGEPRTLAKDQDFPTSLVVSAGQVIWTNATNSDGAIVTAPASGGEVVTLARSQAGALDLTADQRAVFWTTTETVQAVPREGGAPRTLVRGGDRVGTGALAVGPDEVYWTGSDAVMKLRVGRH